jgi:glyoxylase-like metal-dependent hydrolase (beta-lactamase superfamily II)
MQLPDAIQVIERGWLSSNNILLYVGESATLVDAGYVGHAPQTVELVKSALAARRPTTRLDLLVNTHSHSDHIGGNASLQAAFGCKIAIPAGIERMVAEWDTDALLLDAARQRGDRFAHDSVIEADSEFEMGGLAWRALAAPGHDMEALIYYCAEKRLLISGDALWQDGFGIIFGEVMGRKDALPATRNTLEMIGRLDVDIVIPGHGAPFDDFDGAMARAMRRLESFEADSTRVGRLPLQRALLPQRQPAHAGFLRRRFRLMATRRTAALALDRTQGRLDTADHGAVAPAPTFDVIVLTLRSFDAAAARAKRQSTYPGTIRHLSTGL